MKSRKLKNAARNLRNRISNWEDIMKNGSDITRKHPKGFRKPGAMKKS
jgi:hypothetical protein